MDVDEEPRLSLTHTFIFRGVKSTYMISFYLTYLIICSARHLSKSNDESIESRKSSLDNGEKIEYSKIKKITSKGQNLKIVFGKLDMIEIPCTLSEMKNIKKLFKKSTNTSSHCLDGVAFVEFANFGFFIKIKSNDLLKFKSAVIKKIAKFLYPALNHDDIALELGKFRDFQLKTKKDNIFIMIENNDDLDAALMYFNNKIDIRIERTH